MVRDVKSEIWREGFYRGKITGKRAEERPQSGLIMDNHHINQGAEVMTRSCPPSSLNTVNARPPLGI